MERYKPHSKTPKQMEQKSALKKYVSKRKEHVWRAKLNLHALFYAPTEDFLIFLNVIELEKNDLQ